MVLKEIKVSSVKIITQISMVQSRASKTNLNKLISKKIYSIIKNIIFAVMLYVYFIDKINYFGDFLRSVHFNILLNHTEQMRLLD